MGKLKSFIPFPFIASTRALCFKVLYIMVLHKIMFENNDLTTLNFERCWKNKQTNLALRPKEIGELRWGKSVSWDVFKNMLQLKKKKSYWARKENSVKTKNSQQYGFPEGDGIKRIPNQFSLRTLSVHNYPEFNRLWIMC